MNISQWEARPAEEARLLNPAFVGILIWSCARGYKRTNNQGLPYSLSFLAVPIVLHRYTREALPRSISTSLTTWISDNPKVNIHFRERARSLLPIVKEGILFSSNGQLIDIESSRIVARQRPRQMAGFLRQSTAEVQSCIKKAEFVGKWFASAGEERTVMALWGVRP